MKIIEYKNLVDQYLEYNAWTVEALFPIKTVSDLERDELSKYEIIEYVFEGVGSKRTEENLIQLISRF